VARARARLSPRIVTRSLLAVTALAAFVAIVRTAMRDWLPVADEAALWLRTWDIGTKNTPLTGPHSRLGWHHPGPAMFFLFVLPLRMLGGSPSGLLVATLLISFVCAVGVVVLVARTAGEAAALVVGVFSAIMCFGWGDRIIDPWNPFIAVLPFAVFLFAAWLASAGDRAAARIACVTGSVAAQSHLGALPPVVLLGVVAGALALLRPARGTRRGMLGQAARNGALIVVLWSLPLFDLALHGRNGNLALIFKYFRTKGTDPLVGWKNGLGMTGGQLVPWGQWLGRETYGILVEVLVAPLWQLGVVVALVALACVMAVRTRDHLALRLVVIEVTALVACVVAHAQVRGVCYYYLVLWTRPVAMLVLAAPFVIVASKRRRHFRLWAAGVARAAAVAVVGLTVAVRAMRSDIPLLFWSRIHETLASIALHALPAEGPVRLVSIGPAYTGSPEALAIVITRAGRTAKLMPPYGFATGEHRTVPSTVAMPTLVVATGVGIERIPYADKAKELYYNDPVPRRDRAQARKLRAKLSKQLTAIGRSDLIYPLDDGAGWLAWVPPPGIDKEALFTYLSLIAGPERLPIALYQLPPVTW
jgi:hypothetical protein